MDVERAPTGRILHPAGDGVAYGPGSLGQLGGILGRLAVARPFIVATPSVVRAGIVDLVVAALGVEPAGVFDGSREHTPAPVVIAAAEQARRSGADGLVSVGGSSVVDLTKGVALALATGDDFLQPGGGGRPAMGGPKLPHVAVPTTLSGAEFTGAAGITDPVSGHKRGYMHATMAPRWVILDPLLAAATPPALWSSTGMKALADTVEVLCSTKATPLSNAIAAGALALFAEHLVASTADVDDLVARGWCQFAVAMVLPQLVGVGVGLVAGLRHQLGGALGVGHGVASTIVLPHVVRWNAGSCVPALQRAANAFGVADGEAVVIGIEQMTAELGLPTRLRDVGVQRDDLPGVAEHVLADNAVITNPRPVHGVDDVLEVLTAAW